MAKRNIATLINKKKRLQKAETLQECDVSGIDKMRRIDHMTLLGSNDTKEKRNFFLILTRVIVSAFCDVYSLFLRAENPSSTPSIQPGASGGLSKHKSRNEIGGKVNRL